MFITRRVLALQVVERAEPNRNRFRRDDVAQPIYGQFANIPDALRNRKVLRQAVQQCDFLERHQQMRGDVGELPLHLGGRLLHHRFFANRQGDFDNGLGGPGCLRLRPSVRFFQVNTKFGSGGRDLLLTVDWFAKDRRNSDHRRGRSRRGKRNGQQQEGRDLIDDFWQRALGHLLTTRQPSVEVDRQSGGSGTHNLSSAAVDDRERGGKCPLDRSQDLASLSRQNDGGVCQ